MFDNNNKSKNPRSDSLEILIDQFKEMVDPSTLPQFQGGIDQIRKSLNTLVHLLSQHHAYTEFTKIDDGSRFRLSYTSQRLQVEVHCEIDLNLIFEFAIEGLLKRIDFPGFKWIDAVENTIGENGEVHNPSSLPMNPETGDLASDAKYAIMSWGISQPSTDK